MDPIVTFVPDPRRDPLEDLAHPAAGASLVELRTDLAPDLDVAAAVRACPLPVLVSCRSEREGGRGPADPAARRELVTAARDAGAALLDLEADRDLPLLAGLGLEPERVVLSWHDPDGTPDDLEAVADRLAATGVRWVKVVPTARRLADALRVVALHRRLNRPRRHQRRLVTFAMGEIGIVTRYLAPLLGPALTFAAWSAGRRAAPGQLTVDDLRAAVGHLDGPPQRLFGVIGAHAGRSLSPRMHGAGFQARGLPYALLPISLADEDELDLLIAPRGTTAFDRLGLPAAGWAVTTPFKGQAARRATLQAPRVRRAGAANTLLLQEGRIAADTTDADGVVGALRQAEVDAAGCTAVVQGTGGAARGAAVGLHLAGAEVLLRGRDADRTRAVAGALKLGWLAPDDPAPSGAVLVNATPLGTASDEPAPFSAEEVAAAAAVVDFVYADAEPRLGVLARAAGVPYADGRSVLLHQGMAQFAAFTTTLPPREEMAAALQPPQAGTR